MPSLWALCSRGGDVHTATVKMFLKNVAYMLMIIDIFGLFSTSLNIKNDPKKQIIPEGFQNHASPLLNQLESQSPKKNIPE